MKTMQVFVSQGVQGLKSIRFECNHWFVRQNRVAFYDAEGNTIAVFPAENIIGVLDETSQGPDNEEAA